MLESGVLYVGYRNGNKTIINLDINDKDLVLHKILSIANVPSEEGAESLHITFGVCTKTKAIHVAQLYSEDRKSIYFNKDYFSPFNRKKEDYEWLKNFQFHFNLNEYLEIGKKLNELSL